jgi:Tfp pilus assembly protein PilN
VTRIDLLPPRYHRVRSLARQVRWGLTGLAALLMVLGTVQAALRVHVAAYEQRSSALLPRARQYRTINARFAQLEKAEAALLARRAKAQPLLGQGRSILPQVQDFTGGLPSGTRLISLTVELNGQIALSGEAKSYRDVSRFVKWIGETLRYEKVVLAGVRRGHGQQVGFSVTAMRPQGGDGE